MKTGRGAPPFYAKSRITCIFFLWKFSLLDGEQSLSYRGESSVKGQVCGREPVPRWLPLEATAHHPLPPVLPAAKHCPHSGGPWKGGAERAFLRSEALEQEEYFKGREGRRHVRLRLFGFPGAVGCGKHGGWQTWTGVRKWPGKHGRHGSRGVSVLPCTGWWWWMWCATATDDSHSHV